MLKRPLPSEVPERLMPFSTSVAVTVALGSTALLGSVTVPVISPEAPVPWASAEMHSSKHTAIVAKQFLQLIQRPRFQVWRPAMRAGGFSLFRAEFIAISGDSGNEIFCRP